ncbi:MAG: 50S ribosomal protein L10 [Candidatus Promineifilaceae bacterium]
MAISRTKKEDLVAEYTDLIAQSDALILAEYRGLAVKDMEALRDKVRTANGAIYVTKNTLLKRALEESGVDVPDDLLYGQVATGFALGDAPTLAKALVNYSDDEEKFVIRGGIMHMEILSDEQIKALATLPTLDELRAQILGVINAPARNIASVVASSVRQVVNVIDAYSKKQEGTPEAEAA